MSSQQTRVMMGHFRKATMSSDPYVKYMMSPNDARIWYALLGNFDGNDGEFAGGQYLVRIEAPKDFPFKPPWFYFMTPNGVYDTEKKVCIDIGGYHADNYRATLGMPGFTLQLVNGMICYKDLGGGISLLATNVATKRGLATASSAYNLEHHADIVQGIEESYAAYSEKWKKTAPV